MNISSIEDHLRTLPANTKSYHQELTPLSLVELVEKRDYDTICPEVGTLGIVLGEVDMHIRVYFGGGWQTTREFWGGQLKLIKKDSSFRELEAPPTHMNFGINPNYKDSILKRR